MVRIAGDGMSASVDVGVGEPAEADRVLDALRRAGVVFGVDAQACDRVTEIVRDPEGRAEGLLVATGVAPVFGSDGYFSPAFEPGILPGHIDADGKMDFRDRALLKPVKAQAPLGFLHPPIPGVAGTRVDGGEVAVAPVREAPLALGAGVQRAPEGHVRAAVDGVILFVPGKQLDVVRQHKHRGDVDLRSGHLDMAGSLSIGGDVQRLFHVRATGDVEIVGSVYGGEVHAGGSVAVKGMLMGGPEGEVIAGGDVQARSAERARIRSGGLVKLENAVHCSLEAKVIEVGALRGGTAHVERFLFARELGFPQHGETAVRAGIPIATAHEEVRAAAASARDERVLQRARAGRDGDRASKPGRGRPSLQRDELQRLLALRQKREELQMAAHVVVQAVAHPGVTIQLGDARLTLDHPIVNARFKYDESSRSIRIERFVP